LNNPPSGQGGGSAGSSSSAQPSDFFEFGGGLTPGKDRAVQDRSGQDRTTPGRSGATAFPANSSRSNDRGFVPPAREEAFPPAPGSAPNTLERTPTPAPPLSRDDVSPEPPLSGPLSPVRHEEPGKLAKSVLAETLNPPPGESLRGQSVALFDALARSAGRVTRIETTKAYWATSAAIADYYIWLDTLAQLKRLTDGARYGAVSGSELAAGMASVEAQLREAELVAAETRHRLAGYLGDPQLEVMCADVPHVGGYRTEFERIFANRQAPSHLYLIYRTLPLRQRAIELRAEAVRSAAEALEAVTARYSRGQAEGRDVLLQLDVYRAAKQSFVHEVEQYNSQIVDYAVGIAGEGNDLHNFVPLLIRSATPSSILTPQPQPGAGTPTAVPPGSALPPAPDSADAGEHSILRSRTRLADGTRDAAVRPAVAEEPATIEKTFAEETSPYGSGLRKVGPNDLPQLQPIEAPAAGSSSSASRTNEKTKAQAPSSILIKKVSDKNVPAAPASKTPLPSGERSGETPTLSPKGSGSYETSPTKAEQPIKQVVHRPPAGDIGAQLIDSARIPPDQWPAALAERLHELPANPLENDVVPTPLRECLRQAPTPAERRAVIGAFWSAREAAARYQAAVLRGQQIDAIGIGRRSPAGHVDESLRDSSSRLGETRPRGVTGLGQSSAVQDEPERPLPALFYSAMRAAAEADQESARIELSAACYQLTIAARQPASGAWLWPGTRPPAERLALLPKPPPASTGSAPATQAAVAQRHLESIITGSYALLGDRAEAVIKADAARAEVAMRGNSRCLAAPYHWVQRQHDETLQFLGALTRYHLAYADYTLANTPANAPPETLAQRLLTSEPVRR
jgi:hypothetical protein